MKLTINERASDITLAKVLKNPRNYSYFYRSKRKAEDCGTGDFHLWGLTKIKTKQYPDGCFCWNHVISFDCGGALYSSLEQALMWGWNSIEEIEVIDNMDTEGFIALLRSAMEPSENK